MATAASPSTTAPATAVHAAPASTVTVKIGHRCSV